MRNLIFVRAERFDLDQFRDRIEAIRDAFDLYLDSYPAKTSRTKTGLMGPVGKILSEARSGKWDAESLTGYALNIHLSNPKAKGFIGTESREALRRGVADLMALLAEVPPASQDKLIDRIDYGLYFTRRSKGMERLERIRQEFVEFLRGKYGTAEATAAAWGEKPEALGSDFERVTYPSRRQFEEAKGQKKADIGEFAPLAKLKGYELDEEEEE
jgi:hypothetical protein